MILRTSSVRATCAFLLPFRVTAATPILSRTLHLHVKSRGIPAPTPFVPDVQTFLTLIGRNLVQHASKIPSWEALFSLTSQQLREVGIEHHRSRRYLLRWRAKFRDGDFGIGGDAQAVKDGEAHLRVVTVPRGTAAAVDPTSATATLSPGMKKIIVNVDPETNPSELPVDVLKPLKGLKLKGSDRITGPHVQQVKGYGGQAAKIVVKEGLWEDRRGHKIDGGERRRAEVRAKKIGEEKRKSREQRPN